MALDAFWKNKKIVALAGGVGGAKFAHGLAKLLPAGNLTVIVNTGDDFVHYGLNISPDLDTVMYTLAGYANPVTGWGILNETWHMAEMMKIYDEPIWFNLGDHDLATHLIRTHGLRNGETLTAITRRLSSALGIQHHILPASDDTLATIVETKESGTLNFQEYFVKYRWQPTVTSITFKGEDTAQTTSAVMTALNEADMIVICPSNPMLSIEPLLKPAGLRARIESRQIPCVAISPLIGGKAVKGPADKLMTELDLPATQTSIARYYAGLIDGLVVDTTDAHEGDAVREAFPEMSILATETLMKNEEDRAVLAESVLNWTREVLL
ncbi:MAG: 2-phospho-L-lactate transferase [Chloroflexi bacterium]|nr:2-phospho-L-lactate transferase [Chloroflexota bacterium]